MEGYWKVYFLTQHKDYDNICERLAKVSDRAIFYLHPGGKKHADRPHIHGLLVNCGKTAKTVREWLRTEFGLKVNGGEYAVSSEFEWNGKKTKMTDMHYPRYITYMSKGQYDPVYTKDFSKEETDMAKFVWVEPEKDVPKTIVIEPREKVIKKLTQWQLAREAEIEYLIQYPDEIIENYCPRKMAQIIITLCQKNKILTHKILVRNILQDVQAVVRPDSFVDQVVFMA